mgnify:CR=1 FL=1|jgi:hypothetical protein
MADVEKCEYEKDVEEGIKLNIFLRLWLRKNTYSICYLLVTAQGKFSSTYIAVKH